MSKEPVVNAQYIAAAVQAVIMLGLGMVVSLGWVTLDANQLGSVEKFVAALLALAVLIVPQIIAARWARGKVTPIAAPRMPDGQAAVIVPLATAQMLGVAPLEGRGEGAVMDHDLRHDAEATRHDLVAVRKPAVTASHTLTTGVPTWTDMVDAAWQPWKRLSSALPTLCRCCCSSGRREVGRMARRGYSDETKAQVMAALLAGQSISEVAARYQIPSGTVKSWRRNSREFRPVDTQKGAEIGDLLLEYLRENLITLRVQVEHFRDPKWLSRQDASELAVLHGVVTDKAIRLLEAIDAGDDR